MSEPRSRAVVKAVTLEVSTKQAQKLALASTLGSLSLVLRAAGVADLETTRRINVADLSREDAKAPLPPTVAEAPALKEEALSQRTTTVSVARALKRQEYIVPMQFPEAQSVGKSGKVSQNF